MEVVLRNDSNGADLMAVKKKSGINAESTKPTANTVRAAKNNGNNNNNRKKLSVKLVASFAFVAAIIGVSFYAVASTKKASTPDEFVANHAMSLSYEQCLAEEKKTMQLGNKPKVRAKQVHVDPTVHDEEAEEEESVVADIMKASAVFSEETGEEVSVTAVKTDDSPGDTGEEDSASADGNNGEGRYSNDVDGLLVRRTLRRTVSKNNESKAPSAKRTRKLECQEILFNTRSHHGKAPKAVKADKSSKAPKGSKKCKSGKSGKSGRGSKPTNVPSPSPSAGPSYSPSSSPSAGPLSSPSAGPSSSSSPSLLPTAGPSLLPTLRQNTVVANNDAADMSNQQMGDFPVLVNDTPANVLTLIAITQVAYNGMCSVTPDNKQVRYIPEDGFIGEDICMYKACDIKDNCAEAKLIIDVQPSSIKSTKSAKSDSCKSGKSGRGSKATKVPSSSPSAGPSSRRTPQLRVVVAFCRECDE